MTEINLLGAEFATYVGTAIGSDSQSNIIVSAFPHGDWLYQESEYGQAQARATSALSSVGTSTFGHPSGTHAYAIAMTTFTFSPVEDSSSIIRLDMVNAQEASSEQLVRLVNLTSNEELWSLGYMGAHASWYSQLLPRPPNATYQTAIPWGQVSPMALTFTNSLYSSAIYELTLYAGTDAYNDSEELSLNVSGLVVPEPSTVVLLALGGLPMARGVLRRRRDT